jgi:energy-converting hydrogenase Eha subunit B
MNRTLSKIAAVLAFVIGAMAVFAGGQVLLGRDPGYYVIDWLPVYNFVLGVLTVLIVAPLIWRGSRYALPAAAATLAAHTVVLAILLAAYRDVVASDSIRAMIVRIVAWLVILTLLIVQSRRSRPVLA